MAGDVQRLIFLKEEQIHYEAVSCEGSCSLSSLIAQHQYKITVTQVRIGSRTDSALKSQSYYYQ